MRREGMDNGYKALQDGISNRQDGIPNRQDSIPVRQNGKPNRQDGAETCANSHPYPQTVVHRLSRAIGHLESVKKMMEDGRSSADVLLQISAVRGALNSVSRIVLKDYMEHCIADALEQGSESALEELNRVIYQIIQ